LARAAALLLRILVIGSGKNGSYVRFFPFTLLKRLAGKTGNPNV
jgi:hypothetical protein